MTRLLPQQRCEVCGGSLVPPKLLDLNPMNAPEASEPDYVCVECQRPYHWRGNPPRLASLRIA